MGDEKAVSEGLGLGSPCLRRVDTKDAWLDTSQVHTHTKYEHDFLYDVQRRDRVRVLLQRQRVPVQKL